MTQDSSPSSPSGGLPTDNVHAFLNWRKIKKATLSELIQLNEQYRKNGGNGAPLDVSFEALVRATGPTPLEKLTTEDIVAVTAGLLHNLRKQPSTHDWEYVLLMKLVWDQHLDAVRQKPEILKAHRSELTNLADNIAAIVPREHDMGEKLPEPLEWDTRRTLGELRADIDYYCAKMTDPATEEDALLQWARATLTGARIKLGYDADTKKVRYTIELDALKRSTRTSQIATKLQEIGVEKLKMNSRQVQVIPKDDSPLASLLETLAKAGKAIG
jgi:hypothetical protein